MPFVASTTLPAQTSKVVQRHCGARVSYAGTFITAGTKQGYTLEMFRYVVPIAMFGAYDLAVVAPRIGEGVFVRWAPSIEAHPCRLAEQMCADKTALSLPVNAAIDSFAHDAHGRWIMNQCQ